MAFWLRDVPFHFCCFYMLTPRRNKTIQNRHKGRQKKTSFPDWSKYFHMYSISISLIIFSTYISNKMQIAKTTAKIRGGKVTQNQDLHKRQRKGGYPNFSFDIFNTSPPYSPYRGPGVIGCWHHNYKQHIGVSSQCVEPSCNSVEWVARRSGFSPGPALHFHSTPYTTPRKIWLSRRKIFTQWLLLTTFRDLCSPTFHPQRHNLHSAQYTSKETECTVLNLNLSENFKSEKSNSCICILSISLPYRYYDINAIAWLWYLTEFCAHQRWEILSGWVWSHFGVLLPFVALASIALTHILLPTPLPIAPLLIHKLKTKLQRNAEA